MSVINISTLKESKDKKEMSIIKKFYNYLIIDFINNFMAVDLDLFIEVAV